MNWNNESYHKTFSHIYVEDAARDWPLTDVLLKRFADAQVIPIKHYLDVFSPHRQDFFMQKQAPKLILAVKEGNLVYPGAPVCQSFGNEHFYYTSNIMNCLYDCEYCYLQGMYPSANLVLFVNLPDILSQVDELLKKHPVYLCISYDTDLLALEGLTGHVKTWLDFASSRPNLTIECRTKAARLLDYPVPEKGLADRFVFAWTLSPDSIIKDYEHHTPSLQARLHALCHALKQGYRVRLCFDPMLRLPGWQSLYADLFETVFQKIETECPSALTSGQIADVSIGTFRISKEYLSRMRKNRPDSLIVGYPFRTENGYCSYGSEADLEMMAYAKEKLTKWISPEQIFQWKEK